MPKETKQINWKTVAISAVAAVSLTAATLRTFELNARESKIPTKQNPSITCPPCPPCEEKPAPPKDSWDTKQNKRILDLSEERILFISDDKVIGTLDWATGKLYFTGTAPPSAEIFFNYFLKPYTEEKCSQLKKGI